MKTILSILSLLIFSLNASALTPPAPVAPELPLGPKMIVWAIQQAHSGTLSVTGNGLQSEMNYDLSLQGVNTLEQVLRSFDVQDIKLRYKNPDAYTITNGEILDIEGNVLLKAEHWWKLQKTISNDGRNVSYSVPDWAGNLWFNLQDIKVPFDGDQATVHLSDGTTMNLDVLNGKIHLPAMLSWSQGTLEVVKNEEKSYFDIGTGARVSNTHVLARIQGIGVDSIQQLDSSKRGVNAMAYYYGNHYNPIFETVPVSGDQFTISVTFGDKWVRPIGTWVKAGSQEWKYYSGFEKGNLIQVPAQTGESLYFYFEWDPSAGKG